MTLTKLDQKFSPYQMPTAIIGSIVDEKSNFMLCTWFSRVNRLPPIWMVSINRKHHTLRGINENKIFSINIPPVDLVKEADYVGIVSGKDIDKSSLFSIFYGDTKAPLIKHCTLNIELKVIDSKELPDHFIILGEAVNTYIDDQYLTDGRPDIKKMNPVIYTGSTYNYWSVGEQIARAFKAGKELKDRPLSINEN